MIDLNLSLSEDLVAEVTSAANGRGISFSEMVQEILQDWLEDHGEGTEEEEEEENDGEEEENGDQDQPEDEEGKEEDSDE